MKAIAEAPGKVIISGEHFVVHGATALAASINRAVRVEASRSSKLELVSNLRDGESLLPARKLLEHLYHERKAVPNVKAVITSEIPAAAGLGSSGATMIALTAAVSLLEGWYRDMSSLIKVAGVGEKIVHGNPSGIDVAASGMGGVILFRVGNPPQPVQLPRPVKLLVAFSGMKRNTGKLIAKVALTKESYPSYFAALCDSATLVSQMCLDQVLKGDAVALGKLMTYSHAVLGRVGASNKTLDALVDLCIESGCYGAKLTGAGGGGSVLAVPPENAAPIVEKLKKKGYSSFITEIPSGGVRAWIA